MNMPIPFWVALLLYISMAAGVLAAQDNTPASPVLEGLITAALANNPEPKAAGSRLHLYENKIIPAGSLNDPSLSFSFNNYPVDTFAGNKFPTSGKIVQLTRDLPFPGKIAARTEMGGMDHSGLAMAHLLDTSKAMEGSFGTDVALNQKGKYVFEVDTKLGQGEKRQFSFEYIAK